MLGVREFTDAESMLAAAADVRRRLREPARVTVLIHKPNAEPIKVVPVIRAPRIVAKVVPRYAFPIGPRVHAFRPWLSPNASDHPTIAELQHEVARQFGVSVLDLTSSRRMAPLVFPRQYCMWRCRHETPQSLPEIGRRFGGRDHTTVLHAVRKIDAMHASGELAERLATLVQQTFNGRSTGEQR